MFLVSSSFAALQQIKQGKKVVLIKSALLNNDILVSRWLPSLREMRMGLEWLGIPCTMGALLKAFPTSKTQYFINIGQNKLAKPRRLRAV